MAYPIINQTTEVDGLSLFYRTAGPADAPVLLLLHGYPTSSYQYLRLIPLLSDKYRIIAPDMPGFGFTEVPEGRKYEYTFDNLAVTVRKLLDKLDVSRFALYAFAYGGAVGFRLAIERPEAITAIISQNGNAYEEFLTEGWAPIRAYWADPSPANADAITNGIMTPAGMKAMYTLGVPPSKLALVDPVSYTLDIALSQRPGQQAIQLALFLDFQSNLKLYPAVQAYLRARQPPLLAVWSEADPFFRAEGAEAFRRDVKDAEVKLYETGHFALETHVEEIAGDIKEFLAKLEL